GRILGNFMMVNSLTVDLMKPVDLIRILDHSIQQFTPGRYSGVFSQSYRSLLYNVEIEFVPIGPCREFRSREFRHTAEVKAIYRQGDEVYRERQGSGEQ